MCLTTKNWIPKRAKEDIVCYKIFGYSGNGTYFPYMQTWTGEMYRVGETYRANFTWDGKLNTLDQYFQEKMHSLCGYFIEGLVWAFFILLLIP